MNKSENGHGKSRGRESRVCTWEKITKIRAADGEDSDGDRARSRRWRVWQSLVFCLWSWNVHLSPHSVLQTFCTYAVGKEEEEMWCENFEEELKRKRGKWEVGSGKERNFALWKYVGKSNGNIKSSIWCENILSMGPTKFKVWSFGNRQNWKLICLPFSPN